MLRVVTLRRIGVAVPDGVDDLQALQLLLLALLGSLRRDFHAQAHGLGVHVELTHQRADGLGPDLGAEFSVALLSRLVRELPILVLGQYLADLDLATSRIGDHVGSVVDDALQVTQLHPEQVAHLRRQGLEEPDMCHRHGQLDVPHALAPHLRQRDLDAALVADVSAIPDALELAAVTLPVLHRPEDPLAEQTIALRFEGAVVDRLWLGYLAVAPRPDLVGRGDLDLHPVEVRRTGSAMPGEIDHPV